MSFKGKLVIFTAPSGGGKTTVVRHLLQCYETLAFSTSATTREKRPKETHGKDYYFLSVEEFQEKIDQNAFIEWVEVYNGQYYGTLKSEVERIWSTEKHVLFDVDVKGALKLGELYPKDSLAIFLKPPTPEVLFERLRSRNTESKNSLKKRIERAKMELSMESSFDLILINDILSETLDDAEALVETFLNIEKPKK